MNKFKNRTSELKNLEKLYAGKVPKLLVMYGRRRVGKTSIMQEFLSRHKGIYLLARQETELENLKRFGKSLVDIVRAHPVRTTIIAGLTALTLVTAYKDNVHFGGIVGSIDIHNPKKNQYVWGLAVKTNIYGKEEADVYTFGLIATNFLTYNSCIRNMGAYGVFVGGNNVGDNSQAGNMGVRGILMGGNDVGNNSQV